MKTWIFLFALLFVFGCGQKQEESALSNWIENHVAAVRPLETEANLAYWNAAITGADTHYAKYAELDLKLKILRSDKSDFETIKAYRESGKISDPVLLRQLNVLYNAYLPNQIDSHIMEEMVNLGTHIDQTFSAFRGTINGKEVTGNQIEHILKSETRSKQRREAWLASKQVGPVVAENIIRLVRLRNQAARELGFENYHTLSLTTGEQDSETLDALFTELAQLTEAPFQRIKSEIDQILAKEYGIAENKLRPWHYHDPFFQETPLIYALDLDAYYADQDVKDLSIHFFDSIGLEVSDILARSDLYEKEGKNPHAFCTDIDRAGDVRILCNLQNNERWMETQLHELGHAVYDQYVETDVPYLLHGAAHSFTTEAVAMLFGRLSRDADWMASMLHLTQNEREKIRDLTVKYAQLKQLIFARWAMVMYRFEEALYTNPDQNLNTLWWDLVEKYQFVTRPENRDAPDWASKIHIALYPCYYHNYLLGELLASQIHHTVIHQVLKQGSDETVSYVNNLKIGNFLRTKIFTVGATQHWNTMIESATGEKLTPSYFVKQFVK